MKTKDLIRIIPDKLRQQIQRDLKVHKRQNMGAAYRFLLRHLDEVEDNGFKAKLFKATFSQAYEADKDYLLRNELRHLNRFLEEALEHFLADKEREEPGIVFQRQYRLLRHYLQEDLGPLFEDLWRELRQQAEVNCAFEQLALIWEAQAEFLAKRHELHVNIYEEIAQAYARAAYYDACAHRERQAELQRRQAFALRTTLALSGQVQSPISELPLYQEEAGKAETIFNFLQACTRSYLSGIPDNIEALAQALAQLTELEALRPQYAALRLSLGNNLALAYFLKGDYAQAQNHFEALYPVFVQELAGQQKLAAFLLNYSSNALYLGQTQVVLDLYERHRQLLEEQAPVWWRFVRILAMSHALRRDSETGIRLILEENIRERPEYDYYYGRVLLAIFYYQDGELELALREMANIRQNLRYRPLLQPEMLQTVRLFQVFFRLCAQAQDKQQKQALAKLRQRIESERHAGQLTDTLLTYWLEQELKHRV